jgi:phosphoribosylformylglycinamidine synthase
VLPHQRQGVLAKAQKAIPEAGISQLATEHCYNVQLDAAADPLSDGQMETLTWLLRETFEPEDMSRKPFLKLEDGGQVVEVGPRLSFETAFSSNAKSICKAAGLPSVVRLELSRRWCISSKSPLTEEQRSKFVHLVSAFVPAPHF